MKPHLTISHDALSCPQLIARTTLGLMLIGGLLGSIFAGLEAFAHPVNRSPFDQRWALVYGVLLAGIGVLTWLWRGRLLILTTLLGVVAFVLLNITRAQTGAAWLVLAWLLMISAGLGARTLKWLAWGIKVGTLERLIFAIAVGLGELALLTLAMGLLRVLHRELGYLILSGLTILFVPATVRFSRTLVKSAEQLRRNWQESDLRVSSVGLAVLGICLLGALVWSVAPSIHHDALNYHLGVPAIYVRHHAVVEVPEEFRSYWAHNGDMLYTMALLLVGQPLPTLIHLIFGLLTVGLVFSLGKRVAGTHVGLIAAALFYSTPLVTWESGVAYTDLIVTLYSFGAAYAVIAWWLDQDDAWLTVAGIMAGFGLGTKLNAILVLLPIGPFLLFALPLRCGLSRRSVTGFLRFGLPALLLVAPWFLRDWYWTGNPVFPFFNYLFRGPKWHHQRTSFGFSAFGKGHGILDLFRLPWDLTIHSGAFIEAGRPGLAGGLPWLALPWLWPWYSRSVRPILSMLGGLVLAVVLLWFMIGQYLRYLFPIFPLLAILAGLNIEELWSGVLQWGRQKQVAVLALVVALFYVAATRIVDAIYRWEIPERYPYRVALGLEAPRVFVSRVVPVYDALQFLNDQGDGDHRVLSIGNELRMYTTSRIFSVHGSREARLIAFSLLPGASLARTLQQQGHDFLLVNHNEIRARPSAYPRGLLDESFLQRFTRLEFARRNVYVYRLLQDGSESSSVKVENLLTNSGFEETDGRGNLIAWYSYGSARIDRTGTQSHSGKAAVHAHKAGGFFQRVAIVPGIVYTLGHWTRAEQPGQSARLQINWLDQKLRIVYVSIDVIRTTAKWQWHQLSATPPRDAVLAQVYVSVHENSNVWFDDFQFVQGELYKKQ